MSNKNFYKILLFSSLYPLQKNKMSHSTVHRHDEEQDVASISSSLSSTPTETTPLINRLPKNGKDDSSWMTEFRWLIKNALPIVFTFLMQNSLQMASIFTLGHLVNI